MFLRVSRAIPTTECIHLTHAQGQSVSRMQHPTEDPPNAEGAVTLATPLLFSKHLCAPELPLHCQALRAAARLRLRLAPARAAAAGCPRWAPPPPGCTPPRACQPRNAFRVILSPCLINLSSSIAWTVCICILCSGVPIILAWEKVSCRRRWRSRDVFDIAGFRVKLAGAHRAPALPPRGLWRALAAWRASSSASTPADAAAAGPQAASQGCTAMAASDGRLAGSRASAPAIRSSQAGLTCDGSGRRRPAAMLRSVCAMLRGCSSSCEGAKQDLSLRCVPQFSQGHTSLGVNTPGRDICHCY